MATSSKYVLLKSSVLMEYVYADRSVINTAGNEFRISTTNYPIWRSQNQYTDEFMVFNSDSSEMIQDGLPNGTGNVRDRSFAYVDTYRGALLDIDKVVFFNDYDSKLTSTANLPLSFVTEKAPVYDTIKLHLVQGFNFEDQEGLVLTVRANDLDGNKFVLANIAYTKQDLWETLNPSSFLFAGRVYDSFLEFRVLSVYDMIYEYWVAGNLNGDQVVELVTGGTGIARNTGIEVDFSWVRKQEKIDDQDYIDLYETVSVELPARDQFENISGVIQESSSGDYIEFYAAFNGDIIENYITDLNSSGGDYIVLHDLTISEYVWNSGGTYSWIQTDEFQLSQTDNFDLAQTFRPVIKNAGAVAFELTT